VLGSIHEAGRKKLSVAMSQRGSIVHEEALIETLLDDLA
jgi:hypothetical protein